MAKVNLNLKKEPAEHEPTKSPDPAIEIEKLEELAGGRASEYAALVAQVRAAPRTQLNFTNMPKPIVETFKKAATDKGWELKKYLLYLMKLDGLSVPDYDDLDARRNR